MIMNEGSLEWVRNEFALAMSMMGAEFDAALEVFDTALAATIRQAKAEAREGVADLVREAKAEALRDAIPQLVDDGSLAYAVVWANRRTIGKWLDSCADRIAAGGDHDQK